MGYESDNDDGKNSIHDSSDNDDHEECSNDNNDETTLGLALQSLDLGPKKKLLVFSINGLLIHRAHRFGDSSTIPKNRPPDLIYDRNRLVYKRPYLDEFMKFCFERFEVGLWSSAQEHNIDGVLDCAFKDVKNKFLFVWDQGQCSDTGFKSLERKEKPLFLKDLSKVWSSHEPRFSESNTLLIDDKPYKALLNPPNAGIFPETYDPNDATDDALDPKKELGQYLEGLVEAEDVPSYLKEHSFGQPAVGPDHANWDFYSTVLDRLK